MKLNKLLSCILAAAGLLAIDAHSASQDDVSRLGRDLTGVGAEKAGNADGTIPTFSGTEPAPAGWSWGKPRVDYWKYRDEKPLFVIDASNVDKYADKLTAGQIQMLRQVKGYTMPVYPSHRDCGLPDFVVRIASLFNPAARMVVGELGSVRNMSAKHAKDVLGWETRPVEDSLADCARSLIGSPPPGRGDTYSFPCVHS